MHIPYKSHEFDYTVEGGIKSGIRLIAGAKIK
jgi:hypothetical protein